MKKLLIGGSPCTHWSIAKTKDRETKPSGTGWELFKCYLTAKEKFKPDYFLYENNQSAAETIKNEISKRLGEPLHYINSALVSAQSRKRFYVHNLGDIGQPEDEGLIVKDILDTEDDEIHYDLAHTVNPKVGAYRGRYNANGKVQQHLEPRSDEKSNCLTTVQKDNVAIIPIRLGDTGTTGQANRVYSPYGKSTTQSANGGGGGANTGLYAVPVDNKDIHIVRNVHVVAGKQIETKYGKQRIDLPDGGYIIRKLKPEECERLQTLPNGYTEGISKTQRYKCVGNGWTAEVIKFILSHMEIPKDEELVVLSMFDGIGTGRYVLDQLGYTNVKYYAYEIDPYAIQIAKKNYPDIIELGDAFQIHDENWSLDEQDRKAATSVSPNQ